MELPECSFTAMSKITVKPNPNGKSSKLLDSNITLKISENLDPDYYYTDNEKGLFKLPAVKVMTQAFVQGLIANVKSAHFNGLWDEAEHMRYIIDELGKSFAEVTNDPIVGETTF